MSIQIRMRPVPSRENGRKDEMEKEKWTSWVDEEKRLEKALCDHARKNGFKDHRRKAK